MMEKVKLSDRNLEIIRWFAMPVAVACVAILSVFVTIFWARNGLHRQFLEPVAAFLGGFSGFVTGGWLAPRWKFRGSVITFLLVSWLAIEVVPWYDPVTEKPTVLPYAAALLGMSLGLFLVWIRFRNRPR